REQQEADQAVEPALGPLQPLQRVPVAGDRISPEDALPVGHGVSNPGECRFPTRGCTIPPAASGPRGRGVAEPPGPTSRWRRTGERTRLRATGHWRITA